MITKLFLLFFIYSFLGWIIEVVGKLIEKKRFINRGFLIGPYCPIYGFAAITMTILWHKYLSDPFVLFILLIITAAVLEYFTSLILEKIFKTRWWDYSNYKFNINGRICLETMIPFGFAGLILMYGLNPFFYNLLNKIPETYLNIIAIILGVAFIIDYILTTKIMFNIKNISKNIRTDSTEKINKIVRKIIEKNNQLLQKRMLHAFPTLLVLNQKFRSKKIEKKKKKK